MSAVSLQRLHECVVVWEERLGFPQPVTKRPRIIYYSLRARIFGTTQLLRTDHEFSSLGGIMYNGRRVS
jgi:hypothetical protein